MEGKIVAIGDGRQREIIRNHIMSVTFATDGELTHKEKMEISSRVLTESKKIIEDVAGSRADHNMGVGIESR